MARLDLTSKSWVACIILVLNLVKLAGQGPLLVIVYAQTVVVKDENRRNNLPNCGKWAA